MYILMTPDTVPATRTVQPPARITFCKTGNIFINKTGMSILGTTTVVFMHSDVDKTTYIIPHKKGFEFKPVEKGRVSKIMNHGLVQKIKGLNSQYVQKVEESSGKVCNSIAFYIGSNPSELDVDGEMHQGYPLLKISKFLKNE